MATLQDRLTDAEAALHDLRTGKAVAEFRDQNGETVRYTQADRASLIAYVDSLKAQLGLTVSCSGPMRVVF